MLVDGRISVGLGGQPRLDILFESRRAEWYSMYYVYVLKSLCASIEKSYVGITDNLERRLHQHNLGKHPYTKRYLPWKIIHSEIVDSRIQARIREKYLKSSAGRKWMRYNIFEK